MDRALILAVVLAQSVLAQSRPTSEPDSSVHLDVRVNPFIDLHFFVRKHLAGDGAAPSILGMAEAISAARALEADLGGSRGWGLIEPVLADCKSAAAAINACGALPERFRSRGSAEIPIREGAVRLAKAYALIEPKFVDSVWPRHEEAIESAQKRIETKLLPKEAACFKFVTESLGMSVHDLDVPVYLVAESPPPGGFTHRGRGGGVCFIGIEHAPGALLHEVVIHEAIHALDIATATQNTALQELRERILAAGLDRQNPGYRDIPHTLIFVQAAETTRRIIDPAHSDYGDVAGYYAKVPQASKAVRPAWRACLDRRLTGAEAQERIVADYLTAIGQTP